jgi:glycine cleavage system aminomethyltransferase T
VDSGFREFMASYTGGLVFDIAMGGSVEPSDVRARVRTPVEVGWERAARFDHDFIGRDPLKREMADPKRTIVTLRWNPEDVIDTYASLFRHGDEYKTFDLPTGIGGVVPHADHVLRDGTPVGVSTGTTYSYFYREVISPGTVDRDVADIGTELIVQWGDHGRAIKKVRATVARYPYLHLDRNRNYDLSKIPAGSRRGDRGCDSVERWRFRRESGRPLNFSPISGRRRTGTLRSSAWRS